MNSMNRDFLIGFFVCLCLIILTALTPIKKTHKTDDELFNELYNLYTQAQPKQYKLWITTPTLNDMFNKEVVLLQTGGTQHLVTRLGQKLYKEELTEF